MKNFKRLTAIICMFLVTFTLTLNGFGLGSINNVLAYADAKETNFVVVGDSISYGMSADPGNGFADLYLKHLNDAGTYGNVKLTNLSMPGDKSSDLLQKLSTQPFTDALSKADIVAVSIGGNNLLSPVIAAICKAYNVNNSNNPNLLSDLTNALKDKDAAAKLLQLQSPQSMLALSGDLSNGVTNFGTEFPKIIAEIKRQVPNAQIYVLNLYNPFDSKDSLNAVFNMFISGINKVIADQGQICTIVDVNKAFSGNSDAVKFSLTTAQIDPHPTNVGHDIIYKELVADEKPLNNNTTAGNTTDNNTTTVDNQNSTDNNAGADQTPAGLTDDQKDTLTTAITAANQEKAAAQKSLKKYQNDVIKYDRDYKNLKAKSSKLKIKAEKDALSLQLSAADAQKKAAAAYAEYYKVVIIKNDIIINSSQTILDSNDPSSYDANGDQANIDSAAKTAAVKKAAADKAMNFAKQAVAKSAKIKK